MKTVEFLELRKKETLKISNTVKSEFLNLNPDIFNTKPSDEKWSISECFQHLNLTLDIYIPQMLDIINKKEKFAGQAENFRYSVIGRIAVKTMTPKEDESIPYKMKTFNSLKPNLSKGDRSEIIERFIDFQNKTLIVIDGMSNMNLTKPKISTAAGTFLKMRLGDALHFMIAHNQRHILQAQNVLKIID